MPMTEIRDSNRNEHGEVIDHRQNERAGIIGTILFLERLSRDSDDKAVRHEARHQADYLRALMRRRANSDANDLDGCLRDALAQLMAPPATALPAPALRIEAS